MTQICRATPEEAAALIPCYDWLFAPPGAPPPQWDPVAATARLAAAAGSDRAVVLVAAHGDTVAGFCTAYLDIVSVRYGVRSWVEDLAVAPDGRSRGTGAALLQAARDWARSHGASHLELDSGLARHDAHRFYERQAPSWRSLCYGWQLA
jgi:GNAT superfamily N-acetyltransferase